MGIITIFKIKTQTHTPKGSEQFATDPYIKKVQSGQESCYSSLSPVHPLDSQINVIKGCIIYRCDRWCNSLQKDARETSPPILLSLNPKESTWIFFSWKKALLHVLSIFPIIVFSSYPVLGPILFLFLWVVGTGIMERGEDQSLTENPLHPKQQLHFVSPPFPTPA